MSGRKIIQRAIDNPDQWVLLIRYADSKGAVTDRVVSPYRFIGETAFQALCLCREDVRRFEIERCKAYRLIPSNDVLMPVPIIQHTEQQHGRNSG